MTVAVKGMTELVFVLDRSGSMFNLVDDTVGGYNALVEANRALGGNAVVSTVLFNEAPTVLHDRVPIEQVPRMERADFRASGCTALLDAVGFALWRTEFVQSVLPAEHRAEHVLVAIATDGMENASFHYDYPQVKRMIEAAQRRGWEIVFMAANIDVAAEASRLGIRADRAMAYAPSPAGTREMFDEVCCACAQMRTEGDLDGWAQ